MVAYNVGGNGELVNDERGALIAAGDENEFAVAVQKLLDQPALRKQQGANARRFAEETFSLGRVRRSYEELYATLLEKKGLRIPAAT